MGRTEKRVSALSPDDLRKFTHRFFPAGFWHEDNESKESDQSDSHSLISSGPPHSCNCGGRPLGQAETSKNLPVRHVCGCDIEVVRTRPSSEPCRSPRIKYDDQRRASSGSIVLCTYSPADDPLLEEIGAVYSSKSLDQLHDAESQARELSPTLSADGRPLQKMRSLRYASQERENPAIEEEESKPNRGEHVRSGEGFFNRREQARSLCSVRSLPQDRMPFQRSHSVTSNHIRSHISNRSSSPGSLKLQSALSRASLDSSLFYYADQQAAANEHNTVRRSMSKPDQTLRAPWDQLAMPAVDTQCTRSAGSSPKRGRGKRWSIKKLFGRGSERKPKSPPALPARIMHISRTPTCRSPRSL